MQTQKIRQSYLEFFREHDHRVYPSAPLIPSNDPTLLFTVAGMVQFKDALTGAETPEVQRAASCQLCMRAGGKHNDLENVGYTARHHTLFEMLGNFSFGDYFKEEAITWAWQYVTEFLRFDPERIWITVHDSDDEARQVWEKKIGIRAERVISHPENFWEMGETGPCGPNSEIFYDQGASIAGGPPGSAEEDGDRFLEFWNLVFPQFDRQPDGELIPLAAPGIDTGLGLERTAALMQNVPSNYEIDIFSELMLTIARSANIEQQKIKGIPSLQVIADHIRSCAFLISDGVLPSNEGRGYVLRRIIRRALRHGYKLIIESPFFAGLTSSLVAQMGETYPALKTHQQKIEATLLQEEEKFASTLEFGMELLKRDLTTLSGKVLSGDIVFKLYDTYGFPVDLTEDIAREHGLTVDRTQFDELMEKQRQRARSASQFDQQVEQKLRFDTEVEFEGYHALTSSATIQDVFRRTDGELNAVDALERGQQGVLVLDRTSFYAEAGGQVGDAGEIYSKSGQFVVDSTVRMDRQFLHVGEIRSGSLNQGDAVTAVVHGQHRQDVARNHTATHLLHAALKQVLGSHVEQRGSLVAPDRLRFDFAHEGPLTTTEVDQLEELVNEHIAANTTVQTQELPFQEAIDQGAVALFGEKYGDFVRVLNVGDGFSVELCGGTHVKRTGEIGSLRIVTQEGIAAGTRRIEAVTGRGAQARARSDARILKEMTDSLQVASIHAVDRVKSLIAENKELIKRSRSISRNQDADIGQQLIRSAMKVGKIPVIASELQGSSDVLMAVYDDIRSRADSWIVVLATIVKGKIQLVCGVSQDLTKRYPANELLNHLNTQVGTRGGGRPELARAGGGENVAALSAALKSVEEWVRTR